MAKHSLFPVYFVVFLDMLGFGVIIPVVRDLTSYLVANSGLLWPGPEVYMGILMASYSGAQMVSASFIGRLSDIYGRKSVFLLSSLGNVASYGIWVLSTNYWPFLLGRILSGITGGNIAIAQSIIADHTDPAARSKAMGLLGACIGMGFVLGPALGFLVIKIDHSAPVGTISLNQYWPLGIICLSLAVTSAILVACLKINNNQAEGNESMGQAWFKALQSLFHSGFRTLYASHLCAQISFVSFEVLFAWLLKRQYGFDLQETYLLFIGQGVLMALVQGGLYRRLEHKRKPAVWVQFGLLVSAVGLLALPWIGYLPGAGGLTLNSKVILLVVSLAVLAIALGFGSPAFTAFASLNAPKNEQGQTMGNMHALSAFARFSAPLVATGLYSVWLPLPLIGAGFLSLLGFWIFRRK